MLEDQFFFSETVGRSDCARRDCDIVTLLGWSIPASAETSSLYILGPNLFSECQGLKLGGGAGLGNGQGERRGSCVPPTRGNWTAWMGTRGATRAAG
jgi:hypothetical protein